MQIASVVAVTAVATVVTAAPCVATLATTARRRAGQTHRAHQLLAVGAGLCALGAVAALAVTLTLPADWPGHTADRLSLATITGLAGVFATATLLAGMLRLPAVAGGTGAMLRHLLDGVVIAAAIWFVGAVLLIEPLRLLGPHTPSTTTAVLLPAALTALAAGVTVVTSLRAARPRYAVLLLGCAVTLVAAAATATALGLTQNHAGIALAGAVGLPLGLATMVLASRANDRVIAVNADVTRGGTAYAFVPMCAIAVVAVYHGARGGSYDAQVLGAALIEGFALVARQALAMRDVRSYAKQLSDREAHYRELAHTDPLTGLANRRGLLRALYQRAVGGPPFVLFGLDLDGFKNVNDMRGHDVGDAVLVEVGQRLRRSLRPGDIAARLGGDEFAVLVWAKPAEAQRYAERLLSVLCQPYGRFDSAVFLSASIGLADCTTADDVPALLRNADLALRYAKQQGKCRVERYDAEYDERRRRSTTLEHELRGAIDRGELHLAFQPVVTLPQLRPVGAEALLRWHHPTLGSIRPDEFIPVAEESGIIARLGAWVLDQACQQLSRWLTDGHDIWVSVNVSPRELHAPEYVTRVAEALQAHRVPPQRLVLEVTEQAVATDVQELARRLKALRKTGVRIALDDFGAGYSSLGQLRTLPVDILKIDRALVADPGSAKTGTAAPLVEVVVSLGHRLGLEVIAEGISEQSHRAVAEAAGCRWGQGGLFGWAVPAEHLEAHLVAASGRLRPRELTAARDALIPTQATGDRDADPERANRERDTVRQPASATRSVQHVGPVDSTREMRQA